MYDQTESIIYIHTVVNKSSTHSHEDELRSEIQNNCLGKYTKGIGNCTNICLQYIPLFT
jgi:hypothetical protein